jgi:non-heme chloroperoxidase
MPDANQRPRGTLVLIHAFPLNARMWEPQLALAASGWRVVAPQLRGFDGGAESPASSVDDYAGDVIGLMDALHVSDAVVGGLSLGGYVAFALMRHRPRWVRALVLADTRPQADSAEAAAGRKRMLQLLTDKGPTAVAEELIPKLLGDSTRATRPDVVERVRSLVLANSSEAIAGAIRALMTRPDSTPLLPAIDCPTLIVVGDEDTLTPRQLSEEMHQAIGGSELAVVPKAGHLSSLEQPAIFNDILSRFVSYRV